MSPWKRHLKLVAEPARKIALPLDHHPLPYRRKDWHAQVQQLIIPWTLGPIDGHGHYEIDALFAEQRAGRGKLVPAVGRAGEGRRGMAGITRQGSRNFGSEIGRA